GIVLELGQTTAQGGNVGLLIANVLLTLQESHEAAGLCRSGGRGSVARRADIVRGRGGRADLAEPAAADPAEAFEPGAAEHFTLAGGARSGRAARHQFQVEAATVVLHLPHVLQQGSLGERQSLENSIASAAL